MVFCRLASEQGLSLHTRQMIKRPKANEKAKWYLNLKKESRVKERSEN